MLVSFSGHGSAGVCAVALDRLKAKEVSQLAGNLHWAEFTAADADSVLAVAMPGQPPLSCAVWVIHCSLGACLQSKAEQVSCHSCLAAQLVSAFCLLPSRLPLYMSEHTQHCII